MINKDFFSALEDLEQEKKINKEYFIESLEIALTSAYKKNYGEAKSARVRLDPEKSTIKVYSYKTVAEEVEDSDKQISLEEAKALKKSYEVGDTITQEESPKDFGRIAAQIAKQVLMQRLREAEHKAALEEISEKQNELLTAIVRRVDMGQVFVEIPGTQTEGILQEKDQIPGEKYGVGQHIKVYVKTIRDTEKASHVQVTRSNASFVKKLFELEVPEILSGEVEIKNIVREAGYRTKMAVFSANPNIDPVGSCVGNKGLRVNNIVAELNGEKIDIVEWSENPLQFIARALSPAKVDTVYSLEGEKTARAVVPDDKLSLAIGKSGQNVRLAVRLTGWKIDVKSHSAAKEIDGDLFLSKDTNFDIGDDSSELSDISDEGLLDNIDAEGK
ncbi:MAG: transcription termination factor NusA [Christensenellaceae bacterium]|jgi:N utilization substance protein A|nr:transcription termination factor NusA [Christensenellaceae bacterium]